jgi:7-dehydrocholesterol reductase
MPRARSNARVTAEHRGSNSIVGRPRSKTPPQRTLKGEESSPAATFAPPSSDVWFGAFSSPLERFVRTVAGPLFLLLVTPVFVNVAALAALHHDSSIFSLVASYDSPWDLLAAAFPAPSPHLALCFFSFVAFEALLLICLPGKVFSGAIAPSGFAPSFRANGGAALLVSCAAAAALVRADLSRASAIYDNALELLTLLNASALALSVALAVKGVCAPSTRDAGVENGFIFSVYWGVELYPSVRGLELKQLLISRVGMMSWFFATASCVAAGVRARGGAASPALVASGALNLLYVAKFFLLFERDYLRAADIAVDRMGFMLVWGPIAFMPLVHNLQTLHLVAHAGLAALGWRGAGAWLALGAAAVWANFDADTQRHAVRAAAGACAVWGRPATFVRAPYRDASGRVHENLLLTCGWHGLGVRHFHYAPDILLLVLYCAPAGGVLEVPLAWTYAFYLTGLLLDRCARIDARCHAKYGAAWERYVKIVPWKLVPGVW